MKQRLLVLLSFALLLSSSHSSFGQNTPPPLGSATGFAMFTAVGAIDNNGPSVINGDIGTNAGAFNGFPPGVVNGTIHVADTRSTQAATAVQGAYGHMSAIVYNSVAVFGGTPAVTMAPGAYSVGGASTLAGTLILDGGNDPNATFYLRVTGALTTAQNSEVLLIRGANANNVYWQIGGLTTLGQNSVMQGTLLVDGAIIMIAGAQLTGRGLSREGAITLTSATATLPSFLAAPVAASTVWLGNRTTDWFTATNWSAGVPSSILDASIPTNTSPYPLIATGNAAANNLTIGTGASLTQSGGSLDLKGNLSNSGTVSATAGTMSLSSAVSAQILGGSGSTQLWSLTIANPSGAIQGGAVRIRGVLAPANGNLTTNGQTLTLLSDAAGTALVNNSGTGVVNGTATVQRYIASANSGLGYRHYSTPVSGSTVGDLTTAGFTPEISQGSVYNTSATPATTTPFPTVYAYDQARLATVTNNYSAFDKGFVVPASLTSPLAVGRGYIANISASALVDFTGLLTNGTQTLSLSRNAATSANDADAGWQLVGNPYPAPLDYSLVAPADRAGLDGAIYVYQSTSQYNGQYRAYINGIGGNPVLPVAQGFFARVSTGQTSAALTFRNSQRLTALNNTPFQRSTADARPLVQLELRASNGATDMFYAYAEAGATAGFDAQYDALKLPNTSGLNLASVAATSEALAIDGRPAFTAATNLALNVGVPAAGTYTLAAATLGNLPANLDALLTDAATGLTVNLRLQPAYLFSVISTQASASMTGRFTLHFTARTALANAQALTAAEVTLYPNPAHNAFTVLVPAIAGATQVHADLLNTLGQVVHRQQAALAASGARLAVDASGLAAGVYTLRLQVGATTLAKRVVIQ
ncbi:ice-binding family protein [Hymenobacter sp. B1770]|uniref:ice-binding family protein n=1 Tax=Hymenobacter sp. B1770 TaxID=1718788 RepID=UPI003CF8B708